MYRRVEDLEETIDCDREMVVDITVALLFDLVSSHVLMLSIMCIGTEGRAVGSYSEFGSMKDPDQLNVETGDGKDLRLARYVLSIGHSGDVRREVLGTSPR